MRAFSGTEDSGAPPGCAAFSTHNRGCHPLDADSTARLPLFEPFGFESPIRARTSDGAFICNPYPLKVARSLFKHIQSDLDP